MDKMFPLMRFSAIYRARVEYHVGHCSKCRRKRNNLFRAPACRSPIKLWRVFHWSDEAENMDRFKSIVKWSNPSIADTDWPHFIMIKECEATGLNRQETPNDSRTPGAS